MGCCQSSKKANTVSVTIDERIASFYESYPPDKLSWKLIRRLTWHSDSLLFTVCKTGSDDKRTTCGAILRVKHPSKSTSSTRHFAVVPVFLNKTCFAEQATTTINGSVQEVIALANQVLSSRVHASVVINPTASLLTPRLT
jgi:hypothetical protein